MNKFVSILIFIFVHICEVKYWEYVFLRNMHLQLIYSARFPPKGIVQIPSLSTMLKDSFNRIHHQTSDTASLMGKILWCLIPCKNFYLI